MKVDKFTSNVPNLKKVDMNVFSFKVAFFNTITS